MNYILKYDEFIRSIKQNKDIEHSMLLGAGASIESGVQSASDCIWEWKKDIFLSQNPHLIEQYKNIKIDSVRDAIQKWLDSQGTFPRINDDSEYSYYAETAYRIPGDRRRYFQKLSEGKNPSLGYNLIGLLAESGMVRSVWTTNFDGLMVKAAYLNNLTPIEITLESQDRIFRSSNAKELLCISLHGDYKYGDLKNTSTELDTQSNIFKKALKNELATRNLLVIGYSGRDKSLMEALKEAYIEKGAGRIYWCGYGHEINESVRMFIESINSTGREAYYVPTDGFDKTMLHVAVACFENDTNYLNVIKQLKSKASVGNHNTKAFDCNIASYNKIVKSNLLPFTLPKSCFQFKLKYEKEETSWNVCKELINHDIVAVPFNNMIYAFGTKENISYVCGTRLLTEIVHTPLTRDSLMSNSAFKDLILRTLTIILASKSGFECNYKNKIWDRNQKYSSFINNRRIEAYKGIELSLFFDQKYSYISMIPSCILPDDIKLAKEDYKEFTRTFNIFINGKKPNPNYWNYLDIWKRQIFGGKAIKAEYPIGSGSNFDFSISSNNLYIGIKSGGSQSDSIQLPEHVNPKQILHKGMEYPDPQLLFYNPFQKRMVRDFHPMRGLVQNQPYDYFMNNEVFKPYINIGVVCPGKHSEEFYRFLNSLNQRHETKHNLDYLITYPNFFSIYGVTLNIPAVGSSSWVDVKVDSDHDFKEAALAFGKKITQKIDQLNSQQNIDVIVIYVPQDFEYFTSFNDGNTHFDLHDFVKAFAVQKNISTQFIRQKTIDSALDCQIAWSLSLAIYVKTLRTPWILTNLRNDTAFAGIGYSIDHYSNSKQQMVIGCSHIYSSDGQGLKYKLSKINDVTFDKKKNPYLSENEAYQLGLNIKELFYKSFSELPKRVVIHKRTPFKKPEIKGIVESLHYVGITDIDLVEISYEDSARFFEVNSTFNIDDFPVRRGCCFPINNDTAYLFTHGIAPSVRNPKFRYFQGGKSIPVPLKITRHFGNGDIGQIATEILGLSKMNWNSFELYSKLPCTLQSSNDIAKIGWLLSQFDGVVYDYRNFM
ncbi:SIR2 family protein [Paenibacillus alginolyticus]|uniref:SIR2 family protein n=1 Tax=Paenibacillus alginolyticus TaxID=59839 RepID=UPI00040403F7|nr:SIR2 family protein [Paenibacillus alginolyticus]MCY9669555.1 SIR2 family protein [Paenibacillus alginolyticus]